MSRKRTKEASRTSKVVASDGSGEEGDSMPPVREITKLFASPVTVNCALHQRCVPCAYKLGCFDVALDSEFIKMVPNQRPESCPRAREQTSSATATDGTYGYRQGMSVLTVGDGDFTFSLALARLLAKTTKSKFGSIVATSYEEKETLRSVYPDFDQVSSELESLGAVLCYKVDATRLADTLPSSVSGLKYERICWNFPCTAIAKGQDGQNKEMEDNKDLVRRFVANARYLLPLRKDGEVHICHKTKPPFNHWKLEQVALEQCQGDGKVADLEYVGRVVLDRFLLPPYTPRKALDRKSFPCHDACFFSFRQSTKNHNVDKVKSMPGVPVTSDLIMSIRKRLLQNITAKSATQNKKARHYRK
jgi:25S rRNA (uracil2634-N3)-methyltransferase